MLLVVVEWLFPTNQNPPFLSSWLLLVFFLSSSSFLRLFKGGWMPTLCSALAHCELGRQPLL
jgi:hypothetical protein